MKPKAENVSCSVHGYNLNENLWFQDYCGECEAGWSVLFSLPEKEQKRWREELRVASGGGVGSSA